MAARPASSAHIARKWRQRQDFGRWMAAFPPSPPSRIPRVQKFGRRAHRAISRVVFAPPIPSRRRNRIGAARHRRGSRPARARPAVPRGLITAYAAARQRQRYPKGRGRKTKASGAASFHCGFCDHGTICIATASWTDSRTGCGRRDVARYDRGSRRFRACTDCKLGASP
jgi:hypothetical protein